MTAHRHSRGERALTNLRSGFTTLERSVFWLLVILLAGSTLIMVTKVSNAFMVATPARGGSLTEGVVGSPRFINPLLAISDTDRDLSALVYSGLLKIGEDGMLTGALAEEYTVSEDGLMYTFTLRDNLTFHDGKPVTADDVVFTIERAAHPNIKSPKRANFEGVAVHAEDARTIVFTLPRPYSPFLENLTIGILPKHIWQEVDPEQFPFSRFNVEPVGTGPFKVTKVDYNSAGIPVSITTTAFRDYALGEPYLTAIFFRFYSGEEDLVHALRNGAVESASGLSPYAVTELSAETEYAVSRIPLPRVFAVFWNHNKAPVLAHAEVRHALGLAVDRTTIIDAALAGFGTPLDAPFPTGAALETGTTTNAAEYLERHGWKKSETDGIYEKKGKTSTERLVFSLSVPNTPELRAAAEALEHTWRELGADVSVKIFESGDISQAVIRPREYDALLFGEVIGRELDLYAFWHSSQRNDPGLNIAQYTNIAADTLLEAARAATDAAVIREKNLAFAEEVRADDPALFLYMPDFLYILPTELEGATWSSIASPSERFAFAHAWYRKKEYVWRIFSE